MFNFQKQRFFPLPDFDFEDNKVKVTIIGKILDENFARILIKNSELKLEEIILLDKVQKKKKLPKVSLNTKRCIEGKTNIYLSHDIVVSVNNEELKNILKTSFDDSHFKEMILEYLRKWGKCKRSKIDNLIIPKLSTALSEEKKKNKVTNICPL